MAGMLEERGSYEMYAEVGSSCLTSLATVSLHALCACMAWVGGLCICVYILIYIYVCVCARCLPFGMGKE